jgi:PKD repeat protein
VRAFTFYLSLCLLAGTAAAQSFQFKTTTTLTAETGNNTSASDDFAGQTNGNVAAGNVSKVPLRELLYEGATTRIYAHFMPWFGRTNHLDIGYRSDDPAQVARQVTDMLSRGIDGAIVDWYGPDYPFENTATRLLLEEIETRAEAFEFAITLDGGSLNSCANTTGCDVTQRTIDHLNYANTTFQGSPHYMRLAGRPVAFFFGVDGLPIDWTRVRAGVKGNPLFIFRYTGGFSKSYSDGAYSWVGINSTNPDNEGLGYLDNFYWTAKKYPAKYVFGSAYPGFNNSLAPWRKGTPKIVNQHCGQTWLNTFARAGRHYSADAQLPAMQIVTWNDYEEGTEIESGIDNCVTVTATVSGHQLTWNLGATDKENTVDHYTVFLSTDGERLMPLGDVPAGTHSFDLSGRGLDPDVSYTLYVKATGRPSLTNKMSNAAPYQPGNPNQAPVAQLAVTPATGTAPVTVSASTSGSADADGSIVSSVINFGDGFSANGPAGTHTYNSAGTYTVTATVTDDRGATDSASKTVTISAGCVGGPTNRTVTICAPAANATVAAPVRVLATATNSAAVTLMQVYLDGVKVYEAANTKTIDTAINAAPGKHRVVVKARDISGYFQQTVYFTVEAKVTSGTGSTSDCALSTVSPSVTICTPTNGATVGSPVRVVAGTTSANLVQLMQVYVDGVKKYEVRAARIDTSLAIAAGTRRVVVQAKDSAGVLFKKAISITVQ